MGKQPAFWAAVMGCSLIAPVLLHLVADAPWAPQGLKDFDSFYSRRNG